MKRNALGKGLDALIPKIEEKAEKTEITHLPVESISPNPYQPRRDFPEESLQELSDSIATHGVLQPIIVRSTATGYELIAGERRWRATRLAGLKEIPSRIISLTNQETLEYALIENLQREDLNPMDAAQAYQQLQDDFGLTQEEISLQVGKQRSTVANTMRLMKLTAEMKKALQEGVISEGHARAILSVKHPAKARQLSKKIVKKGLSVRESEKMAQEYNEPEEEKAKPPRDPNEMYLEEMLTERLGTKVKITSRGKKGGRIEVYYSKAEDLEGILKILTL